MDISKFYNGKMERTTSGKTLSEVTGGAPIEEFLIKRASMGGNGNWGSQPMIANDYVYKQTTEAKQHEIKELIEYVLNLAK
jgi:cytochrome c551/c552